MLVKKIRIELRDHLPPGASKLDEATRAKVGNYEARRDPPHFQGDEYHAHAEIPGGYEVSWGRSGTRRHPNKFPAEIPLDAKEAIAKVLGVEVDLLEGYRIRDETTGEEVLLIELNDGS